MVGEELNYSNKPPWTRARMHDNNPYSSYNNHQSYNNNNNSYVYYPQHSYPQQFYHPPIFYSVPFYQDPHQYYYNNNYQHHVSNVQYENKTNYNNTRRQHTTYYKNPYTNNKQIQPNVNRVPFQPTIYEPITSPYTNSTQLPRIIFQGEVIIVNSLDKVKPALDALFKDGTAAAHGVGFDMEWKPNFGKASPRNPTSLIQLSTDKVCVIFKMMHLENKMPLELFEVLASPDIVKIGQSLDCGDNERLLADFHLMLTNSVDISLLAKRKGFKKTNLKEQTRVLLGKNLSKFLCTSNWADIHLTPAQIRYAATDPYVTFLLYHKLMELPDAPVTAVDPPYDGENEYDNQFQNDNEIENEIESNDNENDSEIESNDNDSSDGHSLSGGLSSLKL